MTAGIKGTGSTRPCSICGKPAEIRPSRPSSVYFCSWACRYQTHLTREEVFWSRVNKNGPTVPHVGNITPCWLWTASLDKRGYGQQRSVENGKMYMRKAHRISYEIANGPIAGGLWVLHRCDTPACVNPEHLFLGTVVDNVGDMMIKGRDYRGEPRRGERNHSAKVTDAQALEIRRLCAGGMIQREAGEKYGITQAAVSSIVLGKNFKHLPFAREIREMAEATP